ncbi:MAG: hypothetical protein EAZ90_07190 [Oscillatoriales cyanobacterium]|nr:MAG: hypothetical protein EAZ90_07190 [Oscillatoriales cyanobacterium]
MVTAQLSLFATSPAVGTLYKAGDWVKLRKKPSGAAAWVKRGEVFRIESVHPVDGSMRFWNPHINEWGFLYPDEVSLVPAPNDSVSEAITPVEVDTESNSPNDSVSEAIAPVEVDTESNEYFRFSYRDGSRMRHIHIRGGNTDSPIAQARVEKVRSLLAAGISAVEVVGMLRR